MSADKEMVITNKEALGGVVDEEASSATCRNDSGSQDVILQLQEELSPSELKILVSLDESLGRSTSSGGSYQLIQRVPYKLRKMKDFEDYFSPKVIAIGPLHHDDPNLVEGGKLKLKLAVHFINSHGFDRQMLYTKVKKEIGNMRKWYDAEEIEKYDDKQLTLMFFLDGCAVLQAIYQGFSMKNIDYLDIKHEWLTLASLDFLLLENQIPYRVLDLLITSSSQAKGNLFKKSIESFISDNAMITPTDKIISRNQQQPAHLLALLWERLSDKTGIKRSIGCGDTNNIWCRLMIFFLKGKRHSPVFLNVKDLKAAGILVKPSDTNYLSDIRFRYSCFAGNLLLPIFWVDDSTGLKFMNLIAYEMCPDFNNTSYVTTYISLLNSLIDQAEDVKALRKAEIINSDLVSNEAVAALVNSMNQHLQLRNYPLVYGEAMKGIQDHCDLWPVKIYVKYFKQTWSLVGFLAAVAGLVLTAIQAYCTIHPPQRP